MTIPATAHRKSTSIAMVSGMGCKWIVAPVHWASGMLYRWSENGKPPRPISKKRKGNHKRLAEYFLCF
jgi:hypothetical protein